jgi:hypothetical protein
MRRAADQAGVGVHHPSLGGIPPLRLSLGSALFLSLVFARTREVSLDQLDFSFGHSTSPAL